MMAKKPEVQKVNESEKSVDETAASDTLHPNSQPADDPMSKFQMLVKVIGALAEVEEGQSVNTFEKVYAAVQAAGRGGLDTSAHNKSTIEMKPSDASAKQVSEALRVAAAEEIKGLFEGLKGQELSEDFVSKASMLFETALDARVKIELVRIEEENKVALEAEIARVEDQLVEKVDEHMNYVVGRWLEENAVAVESAVTNELTQEFIEGLRQLFAEHYIEVPEERVDVVAALSDKVDELSQRIDGLVSENSKLKEQTQGDERKAIVERFTEGLAETSKAKIGTLVESVQAGNLEEYEDKVKTIVETYKNTKPAPEALNEGTEGTQPEEVGMGSKGKAPLSQQDAVLSVLRRQGNK